MSDDELEEELIAAVAAERRAALERPPQPGPSRRPMAATARPAGEPVRTAPNVPRREAPGAQGGTKGSTMWGVAVAMVAVGVAFNYILRRDEWSWSAASHQRLPMSPLLKIYTYDVPEELFGVAFDRCSLGDMYATELLVPQLMRKHKPVQVDNPALASFFLVPHRSTCLYHDCVFNQGVAADKCKQRAADAMMRVLTHVSRQWPYWNETSGANHLVVLAWDQAAEVFGWTDQPVRRMLQNAVHLTTFGVLDPHPNFNAHKDIVIPPYLNFTHWVSMRKTHLRETKGQRPVRAYFRGTIFNDTAYSHGVRQQLRAMAAADNDLVVKEGAVAWYARELAETDFALCPLGWSPWSPRLFEALAMGAVPVIISDGLVLPYENTFNYRDFTLKLAQREVGGTMAVLRTLSPGAVEAKRRVGKDVWRKLFFHVPSQANDAFYHLLSELSRKRVKHAPIGNAVYA